jgi:hypothetical protein
MTTATDSRPAPRGLRVLGHVAMLTATTTSLLLLVPTAVAWSGYAWCWTGVPRFFAADAALALLVAPWFLTGLGYGRYIPLLVSLALISAHAASQRLPLVNAAEPLRARRLPPIAVCQQLEDASSGMFKFGVLLLGVALVGLLLLWRMPRPGATPPTAASSSGPRAPEIPHA